VLCWAFYYVNDNKEVNIAKIKMFDLDQCIEIELYLCWKIMEMPCVPCRLI